MPRKSLKPEERDIGIEDRIVKATIECFSEIGIRQTSLKDIALRADLARQTIYRYFPSRDHLAIEFLVREIRDHGGVISKGLREHAFPPDALSEALLRGIERARKHPYTQIVVSDEGASLMAKVPGAHRALIDAMSEQWLPTLTRWREAGYLKSGVSMDELLTWISMVLFIAISRESFFGLDKTSLRTIVTRLAAPGVFNMLELQRAFPAESARCL